MIKPTLLPALTDFVGDLEKLFAAISPNRKAKLDVLLIYIKSKISLAQQVNLNFICTHNSRRSHLAQIWAQTAAHYYGIPGVHCFSGGTDATSFNSKAVNAMKEAGFEIFPECTGNNPVYNVKYSDEASSLKIFSKKYDDAVNPVENFAAIMTCSEADANCPVIAGAEKRISLPYNDPKHFDGSDQEAQKYLERVKEIGIEMLYSFSRVRKSEN